MENKKTMDISSQVLTLILAGGKGERLYPLTRDRAKPAVPFGGIYRIIDFTLSNCVNSGLKKIALLTQYKSHSLQRHIKLAWNIYRYEFGEYIDIIPPQHRMIESWYSGTADAIFQNIYLINNEKPKYVLILAGDHIYKMNYKRMIDFHIEKGAELTVGVFEIPVEEAYRFGVMAIDEKQRITHFVEKPKVLDGIPIRDNVIYASMGIYVFNTEVLVSALAKDFKDDTSQHDFGKNIVPKLVSEGNVYAFVFGDRNAYWRDIGTIYAYFEANMDLVKENPPFDIYDPSWPIRTLGIVSPPAKMTDSDIKNAIISPGVIVKNAVVKKSVLSPKVVINDDSYIESSIIFDNVNIGKNVRLKNTIIDKNVSLPNGIEIGFDREKDSRNFFVSPEGIVVIPRNYVFD